MTSRDDTENRVLLVTTAFPPNATAGRFRVLKLVRLLPRHGWDVRVLTNSPEFGSDPRTYAEVPQDTRVIRAWYPQLKVRLIILVKRWLGEQGNHATSGGATRSPAPDPFWRRSVRRLSSWVAEVGRYFIVPDMHMSWIPFAVVRGTLLARQWRPAVILTTGPTFSTFVVGYALKRLAKIAWVADYRDLWSGDVLRQTLPARRAALERRLERCLLRRADVILTVSDGYRQHLLSLHGESSADRIRCVPNGADLTARDELADVTPKAGTFVHTGNLYDTRNPVEFFQAFSQLAAGRQHASPLPSCILAGQLEPQVRAALVEASDSCGIGRSPFALPGELTHADSIRLQRSAFVLLLFVNRGSMTEGTVPGKLYEYLAARRPILVVTDGGNTAEIVRRGRVGWVVKPDPSAIQALLEEILRDPLESVRGAYHPDWEYLSQFDERVMAARVGDALSAAIHESRTRSAVA